MQKVTKTLLKGFNGILTLLLAILGFAACRENSVEYGTPYATYKFNGTVESAETKQPVENIKVTIGENITQTNEEGEFSVDDAQYFPEDQTFYVHFEDVDSIENGEYQDLDTIVESENAQFTNGDGDWYAGETTIEIDVQMKPKK